MNAVEMALAEEVHPRGVGGQIPPIPNFVKVHCRLLSTQHIGPIFPLLNPEGPLSAPPVYRPLRVDSLHFTSLGVAPFSSRIALLTLDNPS